MFSLFLSSCWVFTTLCGMPAALVSPAKVSFGIYARFSNGTWLNIYWLCAKFTYMCNCYTKIYVKSVALILNKFKVSNIDISLLIQGLIRCINFKVHPLFGQIWNSFIYRRFSFEPLLLPKVIKDIVCALSFYLSTGEGCCDAREKRETTLRMAGPWRA